MSSVNSVRISGLATGLDTDQMIKDMLIGEQNKIDKANQTQQSNKWKQEIYRDVIKDVKGLYDKYFSATSSNYILSSKVFSTMTVTSGNSNVITATAGAGTNNINYKFKVDAVAQPARVESKILGKEDTISATDTKITINGKEIDIKSGAKVSDVVKSINDTFPNGEVKAIYSEMTGKLTIETNKTGQSSELVVEGNLFNNMKIESNGTLVGTSGTVKGSNNKITVYAADGVTELKTMENESNTFTIDNITYSVNGVSTELVSMTSKTDTQSTTDKMKAFIDDYNKMVDKIYDLATEKKNTDYPPLTEAQREDMDKDEIEKWEEKAKVGLLRNDSELRSFMEGIKSALMGPIGTTLDDIGIKSDSNYNKQGQLVLDEEKLKKALEANGDLVYKTATTVFEKIKEVTYNYAGSSSGLFVKKAGMEKTSTAVNNIFSEQIRTQEKYIKNLIAKMKEKEEKLYAKFAKLESSMNKLNSQMNYMTSELS